MEPDEFLKLEAKARNYANEKLCEWWDEKDKNENFINLDKILNGLLNLNIQKGL